MLDIKLLINRILKNGWMLASIPLISAICAYALLEFTSKTYVSTAKLSTGFTTNTKINLTNERFQTADAWLKFDNLMAMIRSELLLNMLSYDLFLHDFNTKEPFRILDDKVKNEILTSEALLDSTVQIFTNKKRDFELLSSYNSFEKSCIELLENYEYLPWMLGENLEVNREASSDYVAIKFTSEDPHLSAFVVNSLSKQYIRYDSIKTVTYASRSIDFFSSLVENKKKTLDQKNQNIEDYKARNKFYGNAEDNQGAGRLLSLEEQRLENEAEVRRLQISLESINNKITESQNFNKSEKNASIAMIVALKERINSLNQQFINEGSTDNELIVKISELRRLLRAEIEKYPSLSNDLENGNIKSIGQLIEEKNELSLELKIANANNNTVKRNIITLRQGLSGSQVLSANLAILVLEKETISKEYFQAVERYNIEKNKALASFSNIQIIQEGKPDEYPESLKKRKIIVILAFMASLSICVLALTALEFFDTRIRYSQNFKNITLLNLLGKTNKENNGNIELRNILSSNGTTDQNNVELLRKIRYKIDNSGFKTILFTSTQLNQGKSFLILSLAKTMSLLKKRVLIIDTNFKNNSITAALIEKENTKMIEEHSSINKLVSQVTEPPIDPKNEFVSETVNKNIDFIGNRLNYASPSEIFAGKNFATLIDIMKNHYDYIFLEGPALNTYSDTKELIQFAEGIICVFLTDSSIQQDDRDSIEFLKQCNEKFMGAILNKTDPKLES